MNRIPWGRVGLLGELRLTDSDRWELLGSHVPDRLVSDAGRWWTSRSQDYYRSAPLLEIYHEARDLLDRLDGVTCSPGGCGLPSAYVLADHALSRLVRIASALAGEDRCRWLELRRAIDHCAQTLAGALRGRHDVTQASWTFEPRIELPCCPDPRSHIDGDNHVMTLTVSSLLRPSEGVCVAGILLGGGAAAPLIASDIGVDWTYVATSRYDRPNEPATISDPAVISQATSILVVDDNCGTGRTLSSASDLLASLTNGPIARAAVELHWEKRLRVNAFGHTDSVFEPNDLDIVSPWCYRHHLLLRRLVAASAEGDHRSGLSLDDWARYSHSTLQVLGEALGRSQEDRALALCLQQMSAMLVEGIRDEAAGTFEALVQSCPQNQA